MTEADRYADLENVLVDAPRNVEANGINTIVEGERKGRARDLFLPWFGSNLGVFGISYGGFALFDKVGMWEAIIAGLIGIVVSFVFVGIVAIAGPKGSAPTMVISRAAFGINGNRLASVLSWMLNVGWETFLVVIGTLAFAAVCNRLGIGSGTGIKIIGIVIIMVLTMIGAVVGFDLIMRMQGAITVIGGLLTIVVVAVTASHVNMAAVTKLSGGSVGSFIQVIVLTATGFGLGWVYSGADYSRYLARTTSSSSIAGWTTLGGALGPVILFVYGILLAGSSKSLLNGIANNPIGALTAVMPHWFLVPFIILTILGLVGATVLDVYSSGLNLQAAGLRVRRYRAAFIDGTLMTALAAYIIFSDQSFLSSFEGFLTTLGVPIAAWAGIVIADILMRRRDYAERDLYNPRGRYGNVRIWPMALLTLSTVIGWGLVTNSGATWLTWQGYLLGPLGFGGKNGSWATASIGVVIALGLGFVGTLLTRSQVRAQEQLDCKPGPTDAATV